MQIFTAGMSLIPPRKTFHELYTSPLVKPIKERRLRIVASCGLRGQPVYPGSVFAFDTALADYLEDFSCLVSAAKAERVPLDTPLVTVAAPPPPMPAKPEPPAPTIQELVRALTSALKASKA